MTFCLVTRSWKSEQYKLVARKVIEALQNLPKGTAIIHSHVDARRGAEQARRRTRDHPQPRGRSAERRLVRVRDREPGRTGQISYQKRPEMTSQAIPVIQFFPPGPDLYKMIQTMSK
ncbi:MAG TPA: hypothetical protein PLQ92_03345 [Methanomassiliicoccales archaeon]|nr:hypothetical protein [Methanomassiliicoccales archaeon]